MLDGPFHASGDVGTAGLESRHGLAAKVAGDLMEALVPTAEESGSRTIGQAPKTKATIFESHFCNAL